MASGVHGGTGRGGREHGEPLQGRGVLRNEEKVSGKEPVIFCGVEICEEDGGFWLGQSAYIRDLVETTGGEERGRAGGEGGVVGGAGRR